MAGVGDNECVLCNNDTSFMIIGLIPNLLAPLFVLQNEKKKKKKEGGKKKRRRERSKRGIFGAVDCPGVPEVPPCQRGRLSEHLPRLCWYSGRTQPRIGGCCSHGDGWRSELRAQKCPCLAGRHWGRLAGDQIRVTAGSSQLLCCSPGPLGVSGHCRLSCTSCCPETATV